MCSMLLQARKNKTPHKPFVYEALLCGVEGSRTPVQTSLPLAFYMLISLLLFGTSQEMNQPMKNLAE